MIRSPWLRVCDMQLSALIRLAFAPAPGLLSLNLAAYRNSQVYSTKDTPLPLRAVTSCRSMVSGSISLPLPGFFSPFPHGTCALSVAVQYLALDRGRPGFRQGFSCPAVLRYRIRKSQAFRIRGSHALWRAFPCPFVMLVFSTTSRVIPIRPYNPTRGGLDSSAFARRYLRNHYCFLFPGYLDGSLHPVWLRQPILFG